MSDQVTNSDENIKNWSDWKEVYNTYENLVWFCAAQFTHYNDMVNSKEDLFQVGMTAIYIAFRKIQEGRVINAAAYVKRSMRNAMLSKAQRRKFADSLDKMREEKEAEAPDERYDPGVILDSTFQYIDPKDVDMLDSLMGTLDNLEKAVIRKWLSPPDPKLIDRLYTEMSYKDLSGTRVVANKVYLQIVARDMSMSVSKFMTTLKCAQHRILQEAIDRYGISKKISTAGWLSVMMRCKGMAIDHIVKILQTSTIADVRGVSYDSVLGVVKQAITTVVLDLVGVLPLGILTVLE